MTSLHDYKDIIDQLYDGLYIVDPDRKIIYWNQSAERISGYSKEEMVGSYCHDNLLNHCTDCGNELCKKGCPLLATISDGRNRESNIYLQHKEGHRVPVNVRVAPLRNASGEIEGAVEIFNDNTQQRTLTEELTYMKEAALLDTLTQLPNRRCLGDQLKKARNRFATTRHSYGLLIIDVDEFKYVNDTFGHDAGDKALLSVAKTLKSCARPGDMVGRWGGDEFVAVIEGVTIDSLRDIANRYCALAAKTSTEWNGTTFPITLSVGGALLEPGMNIDEWMRVADEALYCSKENGRNQASVK